MRYKLALFDFDGTLANSFPWFTSVMNDAADKFGFRRIAPEEVDTLRGKSAREMIAHCGVKTWKLPLIARYMRKRKAQDIASVHLFADATPSLRRLHEAGVTLAIVSSNSEANIRAILGPEMAALISHYECRASLFGKTRMFKAVPRKSRLDTQDALCIGDEIRDLDSARDAGIAFGAVSWGYTHAAALRAHQPAYVFETFDELVRVVTGTQVRA